MVGQEYIQVGRIDRRIRTNDTDTPVCVESRPAPKCQRDEHEDGKIYFIIAPWSADSKGICGHKRVPWLWKLNEILIVNAGTATTRQVKARITSSFNIMEVGEEGRVVRRISSKTLEEVVFYNGISQKPMR